MSTSGNAIYLVVMVLLIIFILWKLHGGQISDNPKYSHDFRGLMTGIVVVMGINALLIPVLIGKKWFLEFFL
jgi:hypothetical protein